MIFYCVQDFYRKRFFENKSLSAILMQTKPIPLAAKQQQLNSFLIMENKKKKAELEEESRKLAHYVSNCLKDLKSIKSDFEHNETLLMFFDVQIYKCMLDIHKMIHGLAEIYEDMLKTGGVQVMIKLDAKKILPLFNEVMCEMCDTLTNFIIKTQTLNKSKSYANSEYWMDFFRSEPDYDIPLNYPDVEPNDFQKICSLLLDVLRENESIVNRLLSARSIVFGIYNYDIQILNDIAYSNFDGFDEALSKNVILLSKSMEDSVQEDLIQRAQMMKEHRYDTLSEIHWKQLLDLEYKAIKLASNGNCDVMDEELSEYFEMDLFNVMCEHHSLMNIFLSVLLDDDLFDMNKITQFSDCLCSENFGLFSLLVLRGNIIRVNIDKNLKNKYSSWIRGEKFVEELKPKEVFEDKSWIEGSCKIFSQSIILKGKKIECPPCYIYDFINENFVQQILFAYEWYAVYLFLLNYGFLEDPNVAGFVIQMKKWFPNARKTCSQSETARYNFLNVKDVSVWVDYQETHLKNKTTMSGVMRLHSIYTNLANKLEDTLGRIV